MSQKTVDYYLFLLSPWSYLGITEFNQVVARHEIKVNYKPIDVMETFDKMGGVPPAKRHPSRQRLRRDEMTRWSQFLGIPINMDPAFWPANQSLAAQVVLAAGERGNNAGALVDAILTAVWLQERNIADEQTLAEIADECGLGKTRQALAACFVQDLSRILVVTPSSVKYHWEREIEKIAPGMSVQVVTSTKDTLNSDSIIIVIIC